MIAALARPAVIGYDRIVSRNERSASEGNVDASTAARSTTNIPSRSTSRCVIAAILADATGGALELFLAAAPLFGGADRHAVRPRDPLRPRVFELQPQLQAERPRRPALVRRMPEMPFRLPDPRARSWTRTGCSASSARTCSTSPANEASFRELTGLAGQKPWECVGEILEAAACLYAADRPSRMGTTPPSSAPRATICWPNMASRARRRRWPS